MANTPQGQQPESNKPKKTGYLVCDGALCTCDAGAKPAKLKVKENKKVYINDDATKLLATEKDFNFDPPTAPFVSCKNAPSQNKTCTPKFEQWLKTYDAITAEGKKVLVDQSELMCLQYGGKVTVLKHGQVQKVNRVQMDNMTQNMATELNALAPPKTTNQKESNVSVSSIKGEPVENEQFKPANGEPRKAVASYTKDQIKADPAKKDHPAQLFLRPKEEAKFTATYANDAELISWKVEGYKGASPFYYLQHGPQYTVCFPEKGNYKIEAYGTFGDGQLDGDTNSADGTKRNPDPTCLLEIVVRPNEIKKLRLIGDSSQIVHGAAASVDSVRANAPLTIEPVFLMPAAQSDIQHLVLLVKDGAGIEVSRAEGHPSIVFTPENTGMSYKAEAYFNGTEDETRHTLELKTIANAVKVIGGTVAEESKVRPGTEITFTVKEYTFQGQPKDLETQEIKWRQVGIDNPIATGPSFKKVFNNEGNYIIEAYVRTANALMPNVFKGKGEPDDWRFTVTRNYPTGIVAKGKAKVGLTVHYQMESIFPLTVEERKSIIWSVTGPVTANVVGSEAIKIPFTKQGRYTIKASLNGQTKEFIAECTECKIIEGWWTDADGNHLTGEDSEGEPRNTIGFASWGQDACVAIRHVGLEGEKMTLEIWDKEWQTDSVAKKEITIPHTDRPGFTISLDEDMKKKAGTEWVDADALLYFTLTPVNTQLKVQNAGATFPSASTFYLKVDKRERVKAYFSDNLDRTRYNTASIDTPVHAQVKTTGLQDEELGVEIWESIEWGKDKRLLAGGNRKPDTYGMISIPIKLKDIPLKAANETKRLYIKVIRKSDDKVLYDSDGKYNLTLYKVLKNEAISKQETKAFVVVDVSEKGKEESTCECNKYDLIWGNKVSCEFRKKVVKISQSLGLPQEDYEGANWLMAIMALETNGTFDPTIGTFKKDPNDNRKGGYIGLIQFGSAAATDLAIKRSELIKKTGEEQLEYVLKYYNLPQFKNKLKSRTDLYLAVNYQVACGKGDDKEYVVYDSTNAAYDDNPSFKKEEDEFYYNKKGSKVFYTAKSGKSYIWEFDMEIGTWHTKGLSKKVDKVCKGTSTKKEDCPTCKKAHLDLRESVKWQTQFDAKWGTKSEQDVACWKTCQNILVNSGLSKESGAKTDKYQVAEENAKHDAIIINTSVAKSGVAYLNSELEKGRPILIGVDHDLNYKNGTLNEGTTDHFVVVVGRGCEEGKIYYLFYDVGTSYKEKGASDSNKLYLDEKQYSLIGTTNYNSKTYTATQIRLNK